MQHVKNMISNSHEHVLHNELAMLKRFTINQEEIASIMQELETANNAVSSFDDNIISQFTTQL